MRVIRSLSKHFSALFVLGLALALGMASHPIQAGGQIIAGEYVIHYNAFNTTILLPEVAKNYGVVRSKTRGLLNIAVRKQIPEAPATSTQAVPALVEASAVNLTAQLKHIEMRKISEGDAIYYIGAFGIADQETLDFTVNVTPIGVGEVTEIKFRQQFFAE